MSKRTATVHRHPAARTETFNPLAEETKRQRFERIGTLRMNKALHSITLLGNLASPIYEVSQEDVERMRKTLTDRVENIMGLFTKKVKSQAPAFGFSEKV